MKTDANQRRRTKRMQATARRLSDVSVMSYARRRLILDVRQNMKNRCLACGIEKDRTKPERYPEAEGIIDEPIDPLTEVDCQGPRISDRTDWRQVTVCHECFHKLDVDMWISDSCWNRLSPITPFDRLPKLEIPQK